MLILEVEGARFSSLISLRSPFPVGVPVGEIVLTLEGAARKKQVGWMFSPFSTNQRAYGGWTRAERHLALHSPGEAEMKEFRFKFKEAFRIVNWIY